jgi:2-polyprenyl-3-methyl-5-hydroxy-6-metoxy-1,4-benzoquinol methylase
VRDVGEKMTELKWEDVACDWCGSTDCEFLFEGEDRLLHLPGQFRMVRCRQCQLVRQNPRLTWESLKDYYPEDYVSHVSLIREEPSLLRRLDRRYGMWKQVHAIEKFQLGGRLLDVGCGTGIFLEEVLRSGRWQVVGIEPTETAALYARTALQVEIHQGRFSEVPLPINSFDVITLWQVLEHLDHPIEDLRHAHQLLKEGGWLVFGIPNIEGLESSLFGSYWIGWDLPRHLYQFPHSTLREILTTLGFEWVATRRISMQHALLGHSLEFWMQSWNPRFHAIARWLLRLYRSYPVRIGLGIPLWIFDRLNLSSTVTVIAKKVST